MNRVQQSQRFEMAGLPRQEELFLLRRFSTASNEEMHLSESGSVKEVVISYSAENGLISPSAEAPKA